MPGIVAKLSGKLNFHPMLMAGHILCRTKATMSSSKPSWRHTPCKPQPGTLQSPSTPRQRGSSSQQAQTHIPTTASPERAHYPRDPGPPGHQHKGLSTAKIQTGAATCKEKRLKWESSKERTQLPLYPKPHSPHPWGAPALLLKPHLFRTPQAWPVAAQGGFYRPWVWLTQVPPLCCPGNRALAPAAPWVGQLTGDLKVIMSL